MCDTYLCGTGLFQFSHSLVFILFASGEKKTQYSPTKIRNKIKMYILSTSIGTDILTF
jgi:hypothetical protein